MCSPSASSLFHQLVYRAPETRATSQLPFHCRKVLGDLEKLVPLLRRCKLDRLEVIYIA